MNRSIAILTAAMTLSHAILGCCAHAAQGAGCCDKTPGVTSDQHQHESAHVGDSHKPLDQQSPDRDHECCRVKCKSVTSNNAVCDLACELLWYSTIFDEDQIASFRSSNLLLSTASPTDYSFVISVRSHLALNVLLI